MIASTSATRTLRDAVPGRYRPEPEDTGRPHHPLNGLEARTRVEHVMVDVES